MYTLTSGMWSLCQFTDVLRGRTNKVYVSMYKADCHTTHNEKKTRNWHWKDQIQSGGAGWQALTLVMFTASTKGVHFVIWPAASLN